MFKQNQRRMLGKNDRILLYSTPSILNVIDKRTPASRTNLTPTKVLDAICGRYEELLLACAPPITQEELAAIYKALKDTALDSPVSSHGLYGYLKGKVSNNIAKKVQAMDEAERIVLTDMIHQQWAMEN